MEIIEVAKMEEERFDSICDAGVELVNELVSIMQRRGLESSDALAVISIAMAGVIKGSNVDRADVETAVDQAGHMWRTEVRNGETGIAFDPMHRRPDYVAPERDLASEN